MIRVTRDENDCMGCEMDDTDVIKIGAGNDAYFTTIYLCFTCAESVGIQMADYLYEKVEGVGD